MTDPPAWFIFLCGVWTGVLSLAILIRFAQWRRQPPEPRLSGQRRA
jgi:hypothetical protein